MTNKKTQFQLYMIEHTRAYDNAIRAIQNLRDESTSSKERLIYMKLELEIKAKMIMSSTELSNIETIVGRDN